MSITFERAQKAIFVTKVGVFWNVILTIAKFLAGFYGQSSALIADAIHSLSDFISDIAVLAGLRISGKPRDANHHYGHGKFETLATLSITLTLFFAGGLMFYESVTNIYKMYNSEIFPIPKYITLWIAFISIIIKEGLYHYTLQKGKTLDSNALITNAWHHRTDAFSSIAVTAGIAGSILLGPKWRVLAPITALIISGVVIHFAFGIFKTAINELTEASLDEQTNKEILSLASQVPGAILPHNLKTRKVGNNYAIDMHIKVNPSITIVEAHDVASEVENKLMEKYGEDTILSIHIEPCHRDEFLNP